MRPRRGPGSDAAVDKQPGEFRRSQSWIGGSRPGNAALVLPPATLAAECISALESFIHADTPDLPLLVKAGFVPVQFETIHPFLDGNGRVDRLLIALMLCESRALRLPTLYFSLFFETPRAACYDLLHESTEPVVRCRAEFYSGGSSAFRR